MTTEDRVRTVREAYQATIAANQQGGPWNNPWAAVVAALDIYDEPHTKALAETATRLGYELGRKEALTEIADEMGVVQDDPRIGYVTIQLDHGSYRLLQAHQSKGLAIEIPPNLTKGGQ